MWYMFWIAIAFLITFVVLRTIIPVLREHRLRAERIKMAAGSLCQACGGKDASLYSFRTCRCFGIAPIAAVWETSKQEATVCKQCAPNRAVAACRQLGLVGGWGFPGFAIVLLYTSANIWELIRNGSARPGTALRCLAWGIVLPWVLLALFFMLLILALALVMRLSDNFSK
jgi:hypothetical protein